MVEGCSAANPLPLRFPQEETPPAPTTPTMHFHCTLHHKHDTLYITLYYCYTEEYTLCIVLFTLCITWYTSTACVMTLCIVHHTLSAIHNTFVVHVRCSTAACMFGPITGSKYAAVRTADFSLVCSRSCQCKCRSRKSRHGYCGRTHQAV